MTTATSYNELLRRNQQLQNELSFNSSQKDVLISQLQSKISEATERLAEQEFHLTQLQEVFTQLLEERENWDSLLVARRLRRLCKQLGDVEQQLVQKSELLTIVAYLIRKRTNPDALLAILDSISLWYVAILTCVRSHGFV
jgi:uncharacterized protein YabN with tetrapyrrole methylase and pyrophosphatase domain